MSGPGEITPKQRTVLDRLLQGETVSEAAQFSKTSERQIYRWLKDAGFRQALRQAQGVMLDGVGVRLVRLAEDAAQVLEELMSEAPARADAPGESVRLRAASTVLDTCLKWRDALDFEERLQVLERTVFDGRSK